MKIISLSNDEAGYACAIGTSIKRYYENKTKTNFFDFLVASMNSINKILSMSNLDLLKDNINIEKSHENTCIIIWKNFDKLVSYHDLKLNFSNSDYINFYNKYKRRWVRLLHFIYEEDIIFFIRYGTISKSDLDLFYENINHLNNNLVFYFINVDYDENNYDKQVIFKNYKNYVYINFNLINNKNNENKENKEKDDFYRILNYNWNFVFKIIEKNYHFILNNK
jgi:hypothetical protein